MALTAFDITVLSQEYAIQNTTYCLDNYNLLIRQIRLALKEPAEQNEVPTLTQQLHDVLADITKLKTHHKELIEDMIKLRAKKP